jgi:hypothetical protein
MRKYSYIYPNYYTLTKLPHVLLTFLQATFHFIDIRLLKQRLETYWCLFGSNQNVERKYFKVIHIQITQIPYKLMMEVGKYPKHQKKKVKVRDARLLQGHIIYISFSKLVVYSFQHASLDYQ